MKNTTETLAKRNALRKHWRETIDRTSFPHEIERRCRGCGEMKMCTWSSQYSHVGAPIYRARCPACIAKRGNQLRAVRRPQVTTQALDRKYLSKMRCVAYLGARCSQCGYSRCAKALTFHHKDPNRKTFAVSQMLDRSWRVLVAELDKCDLLCFNCHMEEHCVLDQEKREDAGFPRRADCLVHP